MKKYKVKLLFCFIIVFWSSVVFSKTTIKLLSVKFRSDENVTQKIVDVFEKRNPEIKVIVEETPYEAYFQGIEIKLKSAHPDIDMAIVDVPMVASYAARGFLSDFENYVSRKKFRKSLTRAAYDSILWSGKIYASPIQNSAQYTYINKDLLEQAGIELPVYADKNTRITPEFAKKWTEQAWDWDKILEVAKKLTRDKNGDGVTDQFGVHIEQDTKLYQLQPLGSSIGGKILSPNGKSLKGYFDQPAWEKAVTFYGDLFNKYKVSDRSVFGNYDNSKDFSNGKTAIFIGGEWNLGRIQPQGFDMVIAGFPYWKGGKIKTPTGSWTLGIIEKTSEKKKKAAAKFIEWWTLSQEGALTWFEIYGSLPANKLALDKINEDDKYDTWPLSLNRLGSYQALHTADSRPVTPYYPIVNDCFETAFREALQGKNGVEALKNAVKVTQRKLERIQR